jgi:hypothetical protein
LTSAVDKSKKFVHFADLTGAFEGLGKVAYPGFVTLSVMLMEEMQTSIDDLTAADEKRKIKCSRDQNCFRYLPF